MALAQAGAVAALLRAHAPDIVVKTVPVTTRADRWHGGLTALGGKGLFVKGIDAMLQRGEVDLAVHCLKDVPGDVPPPEGLVWAATPPRGDAHDVLTVPAGSPVRSVAELPSEAVVGTSSVRRAAQLRRLRPDLVACPVRGAVGTRLDLLDGRRPTPGGERLDALVLASSGLARLGLAHRARQVFATDQILPPVGAGVLAVECRSDDSDTIALLRRLNHAPTWAAATAERAMLRRLRGHCNAPIAGYCATGLDGRLELRGAVFSADGARFVHTRQGVATGEGPAALGERVAADLLARGARALIDAARHPE